MLNQVKVSYDGNIIRKISVQQSGLPQYWTGVVKSIQQRYDLNQFFEGPNGRVQAMYEIRNDEDKPAIRHIIDWETIERYWKKCLKNGPIVPADGAAQTADNCAEGKVVEKINQLLQSNSVYHFRPVDKIMRQPVPPALVADNQQRFTMNLSLLFACL